MTDDFVIDYRDIFKLDHLVLHGLLSLQITFVALCTYVVSSKTLLGPNIRCTYIGIYETGRKIIALVIVLYKESSKV